jgi:hypothetical protein
MGRAEAGVHARAGSESTVTTSACGGNESCTTTPRDTGSGDEASGTEGEARSRLGCGLGCDARAQGGATERGHGQRPSGRADGEENRGGVGHGKKKEKGRRH